MVFVITQWSLNSKQASCVSSVIVCANAVTCRRSTWFRDSESVGWSQVRAWARHWRLFQLPVHCFAF